MAGLAICRSTQDVHAARAGGPVDQAVDHPESSALWKWPRSTGRELCSLYPVSVDRAVDRKGKSALSSCQRADLDWGYKYPISFADLIKILREKIFASLKCFSAKIFGFKSFNLYLFLKCWNFKENRVFWELVFDLKFYIYLEIFLSDFLCSKHFIFSHLSLSIYPIYRIIVLWERIGLWSRETTKL